VIGGGGAADFKTKSEKNNSAKAGGTPLVLAATQSFVTRYSLFF
jgi:hypothetical protein